MIIAFTTNTSKRISRILCRHFRHCVVIFEQEPGTYILAQIGIDGVRLIPLKTRDLNKLKFAGWELLDINLACGTADHNTTINRTATNHNDDHKTARPHHCITLLTCVGFAKRALSIQNPFIWTPDQLYRYLYKHIIENTKKELPSCQATG